MIDLDREQPVTLAEAPHVLPAINALPGMDARKPFHPRTIYNWARYGKLGVTLETVPVGGVLVTTREALVRFFTRLAAAREQRCTERDRDPVRRMMRQRESRRRATREQLRAKHGI